MINSLSLAILNIDHFWQVNDQYGYAAETRKVGDYAAIIPEFGGCRSLGDAEFVVGMYGMTKDDGIKRLAEVLETPRQRVFTGTDDTKFQVTFSISVS